MRISPPVRFLVMVLVLWTVGRIAMVDAPILTADTMERRTRQARTVAASRSADWFASAQIRQASLNRLDFDYRPLVLTAGHGLSGVDHAPTTAKRASGLLAAAGFAGMSPGDPADARLSSPPPGALAPAAVSGAVRSRPWSISAWIFLRDNGGRTGLATAGQLGGSQAGARATYRLLEAGGVVAAASARLSRPLGDANGAEAAIGLAIRPARGVPIEIAIERRIALESGARDAWTIGAAGGVDRLVLPLGLELDAYGQAGAVGANSRDLYADGAVAVQRQIANLGRASVHLGGGAWGAVQPGLSRLDVGPRIVARIPTSGPNLRVSLDWRQRIVGNAEPDSGVALTVGADF